MAKKTLLVLCLAALFSGLAILLLYRGIIRFNYPSSSEFPVKGIDISQHQGEIDWQKLKGEEISFVFIKATEGGDFKDPRFRENWAHAKDAGFLVSGYHFYRLCRNGIEQAENFISAVPRQMRAIPPAVDLEFGGNCETDRSSEQIISEIQEYIDRIEEHYGQKPIIYATEEFYDRYLQNQLNGCLIWIRDIYGKPKLKDGRKWSFWQYANRGYMKGIKGFVDLNVFNGSELDFEKIKRSQ